MNKLTKKQTAGGGCLHRLVRNKNGNHNYYNYTNEILEDKENHNSLTERSLLASLECHDAFCILADKSQRHFLKYLLDRWKSLDLPSPKFDISNKYFSEWSLEFLNFLDSYNISNAKVRYRPTSNLTDTSNNE